MLNIIFEDENYLVIDKPAKQHTVLGKNKGSLVEDIINYNSNFKDLGGTDNAGLISRLDFETSGLILAIKNSVFFSKLPTKKIYLACLEGNLNNKIDSDLFLGQSSRNSQKVRVFAEEPKKTYRAKLSHTRIIPLSHNDNLTLVQAEINSGFRHQIRSHCAFHGFTLSGDKLYGSKNDSDFILHSHKIEFLCPIENKVKTFKTKIPENITNIFGDLKITT